MSEETIIGPGDPCPYCGEEYGQHVARCPKVIQDYIESPLILEMENLLLKAVFTGCCEQTIDLLKQAIMHQRLTEDIAAIEKKNGTP